MLVNRWALTVSVEKTKAMCTTQAKQPPIPVLSQQDKDIIAFVETFQYLACQMNFDGDCTPDIMHSLDSMVFPGAFV